MRRSLTLLGSLVLALAACSGGDAEQTKTKPSDVSTGGSADSSMGAVPTSGSPMPALEMRLDYPFPPFDEAVELFDYNVSEPPAYDAIGTHHRDGVSVFDIEYRSTSSAATTSRSATRACRRTWITAPGCRRTSDDG